jgi:hypothetical protein
MWSKMYIGVPVKYPLFLSDFSDTWILPTDFRKILKISNFMKICPVGVDRRTDGDTTKLIVALSNFASAPKKWMTSEWWIWKLDTESWLILLKNDRNVGPAELPPNAYRENGGPAPHSNDVSHRKPWCFRKFRFWIRFFDGLFVDAKTSRFRARARFDGFCNLPAFRDPAFIRVTVFHNNLRTGSKNSTSGTGTQGYTRTYLDKTPCKIRANFKNWS